GRVPRDKSPGTHLTVAVDVSASMRWGNRIHMVQQALRRVLRNLSPRDRLSLIVFNERILHRVESIVADFDESVLDLIDGLEASGGTNLAGGLQQALSVALGDDIVQENLKRRMILLTDGNTKMDLDTKAKLCDLLQIAVERGLEFSVLQLGEGAEKDVLLDELATRAKGSLRQIESGDQLCWAVTEKLIGRSSLIARDAVLTVKFRPESVAAYRLLGHESTGVGGLMPVAAETELRAGDGPSALFEVWLKTGSKNVIGEALVKWVDMETGKMHHKSFEITRLQFATSFSECSLSLQQAMLVAEAAEVLRDSPFVSPSSRNLSGVLRLAERVSPRLADRRGFQQFIRFVEEVARLRASQER
ncbi:MAG: VWA domain-containing protein, partial [Planctomycetes bacterium]|nr:VWA domain-containing protein [Planctomycetota bacterium]